MPSFDLENSYSPKIVCGTDEVGLGPLAGPVVVCSCFILDHNLPLEILNQIDDSKKLSQKKREALFELTTKSEQIIHAVSIVSPEVIDEIGLAAAWKKGVVESIQKLSIHPDVCLLDGIRKVELDGVEIVPVVKGDQKSFSISTASIIAKVTRDRIMQKIHEELPEFGFDRNVGYGTKQHMEALKKFGPSKHHRMSYAPVARALRNK